MLHVKHSWPNIGRRNFWRRLIFLSCREKPKDAVLENSHFRRPDHPAAVSTLQAAKAVQPIIFFFTQTTFGWRWSLPLLVDGETFHAAVHLHTAKDASVGRKQTCMAFTDQGALSLLKTEDLPQKHELGNVGWVNNTVQMWHAQSMPGRTAPTPPSKKPNTPWKYFWKDFIFVLKILKSKRRYCQSRLRKSRRLASGSWNLSAIQFGDRHHASDPVSLSQVYQHCPKLLSEQKSPALLKESTIMLTA